MAMLPALKTVKVLELNVVVEVTVAAPGVLNKPTLKLST